MKKYLFIFISIFTIQNLSAQVTLKSSIRHGDDLFDNRPLHIVNYKESLYIIVQNSVNPLKPQEDTIPSYFSLMCTDLLGEKKWEKKYPKQLYISDLFVSESNELFMIEYNYQQKISTLVQLDEKGNTINRRTFEDDKGKNIGITKFIIAPNGNMIIGAYASNVTSFFDINYGGLDFWLLCYDKNKKLVWKKNYGTKNSDFCETVFKLANNSGINVILDAPYFNATPGGNSQLLKIDYDGNVVWRTEVAENNFGRILVCNTINKDGSIFLGYSNYYGEYTSEKII